MNGNHTDRPDNGLRGDGTSSDSAPIAIRHYYVDEAGDPILFNRHKEMIVGKEGCSTFFVLGLLDVRDPERLGREIAALRSDLLADAYLEKIPSMQPAYRKTAVAFHAKDDCPEIRREVFKLLLNHELHFFAVVRDKRVITRLVKEHNREKPEYRYRPNHLYDRCVSRLFRDRLHKDDGYLVRFSKRGNKSRTQALQKALEQARSNFHYKHSIESSAPVDILPTTSASSAGLQATDYFLWALQRLYERGEDRYWNFVVGKASLVHDVDDTQMNPYGQYYPKRNPLTLEAVKKRKPGI